MLTSIYHLETVKNKERYNEVKEIVRFCEEKDNVIIAGDFNEKPDEEFYKYLKKVGYKSSVMKVLVKNLIHFQVTIQKNALIIFGIKEKM